ADGDRWSRGRRRSDRLGGVERGALDHGDRRQLGHLPPLELDGSRRGLDPPGLGLLGQPQTEEAGRPRDGARFEELDPVDLERRRFQLRREDAAAEWPPTPLGAVRRERREELPQYELDPAPHALHTVAWL